jgi:hypothetical protein
LYRAPSAWFSLAYRQSRSTTTPLISPNCAQRFTNKKLSEVARERSASGLDIPKGRLDAYRVPGCPICSSRHSDTTDTMIFVKVSCVSCMHTAHLVAWEGKTSKRTSTGDVVSSHWHVGILKATLRAVRPAYPPMIKCPGAHQQPGTPSRLAVPDST